MDWTNEDVLHFIKLYEKYAVLWNTKHPDHRNRKRMSQAWLKIRDELGMDVDVADIKRKKECLLATYRNLKRKVLSSQQSDNKADIYKPSWYAYYSLDRFLKDKTSLFIEDNVEDNTADDNPDEDVYEDYVEITELEEPQRFSPRRTTGCLRRPYPRRNRESKVYEELRKKKLQLEVRKLEIEVREKGESGRGSPQPAVESQALERLRKRKLELEIRKLELDVWEHEEILGVKHSRLTSTVQRAGDNEILHIGLSKQLGEENHSGSTVLVDHSENHSGSTVLVDHSELIEVEEQNVSVNSELLENQIHDEISIQKIEREDHNYGSVDVDLSEMLKVNKRL